MSGSPSKLPAKVLATGQASVQSNSTNVSMADIRLRVQKALGLFNPGNLIETYLVGNLYFIQLGEFYVDTLRDADISEGQMVHDDFDVQYVNVLINRINVVHRNNGGPYTAEQFAERAAALAADNKGAVETEESAGEQSEQGEDMDSRKQEDYDSDEYSVVRSVYSPTPPGMEDEEDVNASGSKAEDGVNQEQPAAATHMIPDQYAAARGLRRVGPFHETDSEVRTEDGFNRGEPAAATHLIPDEHAAARDLRRVGPFYETDSEAGTETPGCASSARAAPQPTQGASTMAPIAEEEKTEAGTETGAIGANRHTVDYDTVDRIRQNRAERQRTTANFFSNNPVREGSSRVGTGSQTSVDYNTVEWIRKQKADRQKIIDKFRSNKDGDSSK